MQDNFVFSGTGHALGKYKVHNKHIEDALHNGYLKGFNEERVRNSQNYIEFLKTNPEASPFDYLQDIRWVLKQEDM